MTDLPPWTQTLIGALAVAFWIAACFVAGHVAAKHPGPVPEYPTPPESLAEPKDR